MTTRELLQQALNALTSCSGVPHWPAIQPTINDLRAHLAKPEPEPEPVALLPIGSGIKPSIRSTCGVNCITEKEAKQYAPESVLKLYTKEQL